MNISLLICGGGGKDSRLNKALEYAKGQSEKEDIFIFDTQNDRGVESMRMLISKLGKKPFKSEVTTAIIQEAQYLTIEAQNALLKTLEEPAKTSRLILTTASEFSLLPTISSRCQKVYLDEAESKEVNILSGILKAKVSDRLEMSEKINLFDLTKELHLILNSTVRGKNIDREVLISLVRYIRFVERINYYKQFANPRLSKYLAIISLPKALESLA